MNEPPAFLEYELTGRLWIAQEQKQPQLDVLRMAHVAVEFDAAALGVAADFLEEACLLEGAKVLRYLAPRQPGTHHTGGYGRPTNDDHERKLQHYRQWRALFYRTK